VARDQGRLDAGADSVGLARQAVTRTQAVLVAGWLLFQPAGVAAPAGDVPKPRRYALVVGIGAYSDPNLPDVDGDKDADTLADALEKYGGFPKSQIVVLKDGGPEGSRRPTQAAIIDAARQLSREASTDATVLFAFAGHGFEADDGKDYLVPIGADASDQFTLPPGSVLVDHLIAALQAGLPNEVILFLDACRKPIHADVPVRPLSIQLSSSTKNVAVLFATSAGSVSQVRGDKTGGYFLKAVANRMGIVHGRSTRMGLTEFAALVEQDVIEQTKCEGCTEQTPSIVRVGKPSSLFLIVDPSGQDADALLAVAGSRVLISPDRSQVHLTDAATGEVTIYSRSAPSLPFATDGADRQRPSLSGSRVVADGPRGEVYVSDESRSQVLLFAGGEINEPRAVPVPGGKPDLMVLRRSTRELYVADSELHRVHVVDVATGRITSQFPQRFPIATRITGLAISPDERFLYIGNQGGEGSGRLGSISIVDLRERRFLDEEIADVNCPEGMDVAPDGRQLFVASQCGAGHDPLFFVDLASRRAQGLSGFAVGRSVAADARHAKLFVARVGMYERDVNGNSVIVPPQLSIVDLKDRKRVFSTPLDVHSLAMTPGDRYLLAVGGQQLHVVNTETDEIVKTVFFDTPPAGVAVGAAADGRNAICYVWLPEENRLFFAGVAGLTS
jgi:DNA-binding beta-propeller fold protein YncE